jgi:hypothetical protein
MTDPSPAPEQVLSVSDSVSGKRPLSTRWRRRAVDLVLCLLLFFGLQSVFARSTGPIQLNDSAYALVLGEHLLKTGSFNMLELVPTEPKLRSTMLGYVESFGLPYQMRWYNDPISRELAATYGYPMGTVLFSLPWIKYDLLDNGLSFIGENGAPSAAIEGAEQFHIATQVAAAIGVLLFLIARVFLGQFVSFFLVAVFAFGSPLWSTMSRSLWSHTWMVFWLSVAILLLCLRVTRPAMAKADAWLGLTLGTAFFMIFLTRPHGAISAAAIGLLLVFNYRKLLLVTVATGMAWMVVYVTMSLHYFGKWTPPSLYSAGLLDADAVFERLGWLLASPSRGLLVTYPYIVVVMFLLALVRRQTAERTMLLPASVSVLCTLLLLSCFRDWWAGYSYTQRYLADVLPWIFLLTVIGLGVILRSKRRWLRRSLLTALVVTFAAGIFVHWRGANSFDAWAWNGQARGIETAAKDWLHPQFLAGITFTLDQERVIQDRSSGLPWR